jgi:hypothetical protein
MAYYLAIIHHLYECCLKTRLITIKIRFLMLNTHCFKELYKKCYKRLAMQLARAYNMIFQKPHF